MHAHPSDHEQPEQDHLEHEPHLEHAADTPHDEHRADDHHASGARHETHAAPHMDSHAPIRDAHGHGKPPHPQPQTRHETRPAQGGHRVPVQREQNHGHAPHVTHAGPQGASHHSPKPADHHQPTMSHGHEHASQHDSGAHGDHGKEQQPSAAHRIPVVPTKDALLEEEPGNRWLNAIGALLIVAILGVGGYYLFSHRGAPEVSESATGKISNFSVHLAAGNTVMLGEEARVEVTLTNQSLFKQSVRVGLVDDGAFVASGARRIIELPSRGTETITLPFMARALGTFQIHVGLYDSKDVLIGSATRPLAVVQTPLSLSVSMGDKAFVRVPKNGRVSAIVRWDTMSATEPISIASIHVPSTPDRTVMLKNLRPRQRGSFVVSSTAPASMRGKQVRASTLSMTARATWADANEVEHAVVAVPEPDVVGLAAYPRLYDARGKKLSSGPLPFTPGVTSTFWVNLGMRRETRDIKNAVIRAKLAPGVEFTGRTWINNHDTLSYSAEARTFTWETRPLRANDPNMPLVGFEVKMTPGKDALGTLPVVLESVNSGKLSTGPVLADFRFDPMAAAENAVRN